MAQKLKFRTQMPAEGEIQYWVEKIEAVIDPFFPLTLGQQYDPWLIFDYRNVYGTQIKK